MNPVDTIVDVVVVGAGPAGSTVARFLTREGVNTLVLEKRQEIGSPKRCAEGINLAGLERVGLKPDPRWAVNRIYGAVLYAPDGKKVRVEQKDHMGYILERKIFEKHLAAEAIREGAKYMVKTRALEVIKEDGRVSGVKAECMDTVFNVKAKMVVAADGVDSLIAKSAGLNTVNNMKDYHSGFQYEMAGLKNIESNLMHLFFGSNIAPKGYIWIFPKDSDVANVGVGIVGTESRDGARARDYLDKFIKDHPEIFGEASYLEVNSGGIPTSSSVDCFVMDGLVVVGDAAQQVNPVHGGGIALAMNAGRMAAEVVSKAVKEGNYSKERLMEYDRMWRETDGVKMKKLIKLRRFLEKLGNKDFVNLAEVLSGEEIMKLTEGEHRGLLKTLMKKAPKLLPLAKKILT